MTKKELDLISSRIATIIRMEHSESSLQGKLDAQLAAICQHITSELRRLDDVLDGLVQKALDKAFRSLLAEPGHHDTQTLDRLSTPIDEVDWSARTKNCLKNAKLVFIGEIILVGEQGLLRIVGFGGKSLKEVRATLATYGLRFGMDMHGWTVSAVMARKLRDAT